MTDTKTITFEGRSYTVPVWVEWVARDMDDCIYGYEFKPLQTEHYFTSNGGLSVFMNDDRFLWRDSLTKV